MPDVHTIFVILNYLSVFVMLTSYIIITRQTASRMQKLASVVIFSLFVCCIGFLFRIEASTTEGLILGQKLLYSFVTFGMFYMLLFILEYCEYKINRAVAAVFQCLNAVITVVVLTLDHHQLFYKSYWLVLDGDAVSLEKEYGIFHTIAVGLFAFYMAAAFVITVIYSFHNIKRKSRCVWRLWLAVALPCASYVVPKVLDMKNDLQPMAFAAFTVVVIYMIYKNNLYDVDNIASKFSIETLEEALVVMDDKFRFQGCNQLAKDLIPELKNLNLEDALGGVPLFDAMISGKTDDIAIDDKIYSVTVSPVNDNGAHLIGRVIRLKDVTMERKYMETLFNYSYRDNLTGCRNRRSCEEAVEAVRTKGTTESLTVWAVDVNGLKQVNDTKGHAAGDELIRAASQVLTEVLGPYGTVYRTGGDEFVALLENAGSGNERLAESIAEKCDSWRGSLIGAFTVAYGYASGSDHRGAKIDEIMIRADENMYENKRLYYEREGIDRRKKQGS